MTERWHWRPLRWQRLAAAAVLVALVAALFHQGAQPYAVGLIPSPWDKLAHLALFGMLAALFWLLANARHPWLILFVVSAIGAADELAQLRLPGREPGLDDLLADVAGASIALLILSRLARVVGGHNENGSVG